MLLLHSQALLHRPCKSGWPVWLVLLVLISCRKDSNNLHIILIFLLINLERPTFLFTFAAKYIFDMGKDECIKLLKKYMTILKEKYGITSLSLFGSTARGEQTEQSDIDLFVDTQTPNPFLLQDAKEFLEKEMGTSVDIIRNHEYLNQRLRKRILKDRVTIF